MSKKATCFVECTQTNGVFFCILLSWGFLYLNDIPVVIFAFIPFETLRIQGEEDEEELDGGCLHYEAQKSGRHSRHPTVKGCGKIDCVRL